MSKESEAVREWVKATSCYPLPTAALEKVCADADRCAELEAENKKLKAGLDKVRELEALLTTMADNDGTLLPMAIRAMVNLCTIALDLAGVEKETR